MKEEFSVGWIDRKGKFYPAEGGHHTDVACNILESQGEAVSFSIDDDPEDKLLERGWVKTFFWFNGYSKENRIEYYSNFAPTREQKDLILELRSDFNVSVNSELSQFLS